MQNRLASRRVSAAIPGQSTVVGAGSQWPAPTQA